MDATFSAIVIYAIVCASGPASDGICRDGSTPRMVELHLMSGDAALTFPLAFDGKVRSRDMVRDRANKTKTIASLVIDGVTIGTISANSLTETDKSALWEQIETISLGMTTLQNAQRLQKQMRDR